MMTIKRKQVHLTKCWKMNLRTAWFALGIRSKSFFTWLRVNINTITMLTMIK